MHSKWDQRVSLCLMYPLFEVFSKDRQCKTKVYIFLTLWEQLLLHNILIPLSLKEKVVETWSFSLNHVFIVNRRPAAFSPARLTELSRGEETRDWKASQIFMVYGINLKKVDGLHVNTVTGLVLMVKDTREKVSPTDRAWQIEEAVLLPCWMASPRNTRGVIMSCQSNMRHLTMTTLSAKEWPRLLLCIHWENWSKWKPLECTVYVYMLVCVFGVMCKHVESLLWFHGVNARFSVCA